MLINVVFHDVYEFNFIRQGLTVRIFTFDIYGCYSGSIAAPKFGNDSIYISWY